MVTLVKWCPVITIKHDFSNDQCGICHSSLERKCIKCQETKPYHPNIKCPLNYNKKCSHIFHAHCINNWCKTNPSCPYDMIEWISSNHPLPKQKFDIFKELSTNEDKKIIDDKKKDIITKSKKDDNSKPAKVNITNKKKDDNSKPAKVNITNKKKNDNSKPAKVNINNKKKDIISKSTKVNINNKKKIKLSK
jgi:RING-box protein 1